MADKMTEWQMISAVLGDVAKAPEKWNPKAVEMGLIPKLGIMIKNGGNAYAAASDISAETGKYELSLIERNNEKYVLIFPDEETAERIGENCVSCPVRELFAGVISNHNEIKGLQLVYAIDESAKTFSAAEISMKCILGAVAAGNAAVDYEIRKNAAELK